MEQYIVDLITYEQLQKMALDTSEDCLELKEQVAKNTIAINNNGIGIMTYASETQITAKNRSDLAITPQHIDHAVKSSTIQQMTEDRTSDLGSVKVSDTFGPNAGPDPEHLPVSYDAIKSYIASQIEKYKPTSKLIILEMDEEYVLKQNYHYYIHGYDDNNLVLRYAEGPNKDGNVMTDLEYVDDIDAEISSTYYDQYNYWQMFRCYIRERDTGWKRVSDWQQGAFPAVKVKNVYNGRKGGTGRAYIFEYGVH